MKEKNVKIINESNIVIITFLITFTKNQHSTVSFEMKLRIFHIFHYNFLKTFLLVLVYLRIKDCKQLIMKLKSDSVIKNEKKRIFRSLPMSMSYTA